MIGCIQHPIDSHKPPELPTSLFGWIWPLLQIGDEEMLAKVGLDALLVRKSGFFLLVRR